MSLTASRSNDGAMTEEERAWARSAWVSYCRSRRVTGKHVRMCVRLLAKGIKR